MGVKITTISISIFSINLDNKQNMDLIQKLISSGKTDEALKELFKKLNDKSGFYDEALLLSSQYTNAISRSISGIIDNEEYDRAISKINLNILKINKQVFENEQLQVKSDETVKQKHLNLEKITHEEVVFHGTKNISLITLEQACSGYKHQLNQADKYFYPAHIHVFFMQVGIFYHGKFPNGISCTLPCNFESGYKIHDDEFRTEKKSNKYFITQWDIDLDGVDEIIVGLLSEEDDAAFYQLEINVIKFYPPYFANDIPRSENWKLIGKIQESSINTTPEIYFVNNSIKIRYHFRGFTAEWHYVKDKFIRVE